MELNIRFTAQPTPEGLARVVVLIITIITVLVIKTTGHWPGTAIPAVLSAGLAAAHACGTLLRGPAPERLPGPGPWPSAGTR